MSSRLALACSLLLLGAGCALPVAHAATADDVFEVDLGNAIKSPVSGRILLFATPADIARAEAKAANDGKDAPVKSVDTSPFHPLQTSVAGQDVTALAPGAKARIDAGKGAYPAAFATLPAGEYAVQAVLDVDGDYNYRGRAPGDIESDVVFMQLGAGTARKPVTLSRVIPGRTGVDWDLPADMPEQARADAAIGTTHAKKFDFISPKLSAFHGVDTHMRGWVLLPPGYDEDAKTTYPVAYYTHGFGGNLSRLVADVAMVDKRLQDGRLPPMIWVFMDQSGATGTHEFADSANNGPWGAALTQELIPDLERTYRMDGKPTGRFITGHSSGGWASLWLQTAYPDVFGGAWATSPDSSDFRDFTNVDLYAKDANVYRFADGKPVPLVRADGKVVATFEQFARLERVLGAQGGQMGSFDAVFSPRGADGKPVPMFDRGTGKVDPAVRDYWAANYDIARKLRRDWPAHGDALRGRIHVIIGDADTFYLDGGARMLKQTLVELGDPADVTFLPGRTHFDLYKEGDDRRALLNRIGREMYAVARPE